MAKRTGKNRLNVRQHAVKEKKKMKTLVIGFIITGVVIFGLIAYATIYALFIRDNIPVATVNGEKIDNEYYQARVRMERNGYIQQFMLLNAQAQFFTEDPNQSAYYENQMMQISSTLDNVAAFGELVLNNIVEDEIIAVKGSEMGLEVSDAEIDTFLQEIFNYYPDGTPTPAPTVAPFETPEISPTQEAILQLEPTTIVDALKIESEGGVAGIGSESPTATPAPTATAGPTATPYTGEAYQEQYDQYLSDLQDIDVKEKYLRMYMYHYLMRAKVQDAIYADVPNEQEQVWARHILVSSEEASQDVLDRLASGESWNEIAAEVSLDTSNKDNGGDLGWFSNGAMVATFNDAAFALDIGEVSDPIETQFGWHIIQLVDRAVLPLTSSDLQLKQDLEFQQWLSEAKTDVPYQINDVYRDLAPADPSLYDLYADQAQEPIEDSGDEAAVEENSETPTE